MALPASHLVNLVDQFRTPLAALAARLHGRSRCEVDHLFERIFLHLILDAQVAATGTTAGAYAAADDDAEEAAQRLRLRHVPSRA